MTNLALIRKNLFRHKLRASLMIVCILTAFAIFGVLASIERSVNAGQDLAAADRLVVVNKISFTQPLPIAYVDRVRAVDGVQQGVALQDGDDLLLCTDGLWSVVTEEELETAVSGNAPSECCAALVKLARQRGGPDNITLQVLRVGPEL